MPRVANVYRATLPSASSAKAARSKRKLIVVAGIFVVGVFTLGGTYGDDLESFKLQSTEIKNDPPGSAPGSETSYNDLAPVSSSTGFINLDEGTTDTSLLGGTDAQDQNSEVGADNSAQDESSGEQSAIEEEEVKPFDATVFSSITCIEPEKVANVSDCN